MTWRDNLRRVKFADGRNLVGASFRGVPFCVDTSERSGGRRTVVHEFPFQDDPFVEDLGRKARPFRVEGYVVGDDYIDQRDKLLEALEAEGPGELVHPYHGVRRAIATDFSVRESKTEGRYAAFSIQFQETPNQAPIPVSVTDDPAAVVDGSDTALAAVSAELVEQYSATGLPAFALASAEGAIKKASAGLQSKLGPVITATQELAALAGQVALVTAEASSLARTPANIVSNFVAAITLLADTALASPGNVMNSLIDAYSVDLGATVVATTATRARELANQAVLTRALRCVFAIEAARLAPVVPYATIEDATAARDTIATMLDEQSSTAGDTAYPALVDLRSRVLRAVPGGAAFASIVTATRAVPIPSLLLAYQLYGSVDLELDVVARNGIRHPGFIAGDLKVLSG